MPWVWRKARSPRRGWHHQRGDEQFTFPALPCDRHRACGHALPGRAPDPWRLGSARPGMASAGSAVSGAGQPGRSGPLRARAQSRRPRPGRRSVR